MAIRAIEDAKKLRQYCDSLGRAGMMDEIVKFAEEIIAHKDHGQMVMRQAGKIRAICVGAKTDGYWDEKQFVGFNEMVDVAGRSIRSSCQHDWAKKRDLYDERTTSEKAETSKRRNI